VLASANGTSIDCSPKGDAPGFVQLFDDRTLLIPDRPGNNRIDGMKNLLVNPKVGIIFMIPGSNETYRVTGSATISTDPELLKRFEVRGKPPRVVMVVAVEEAFNHCPKALVRAKLWDATARPSGAPSHGDFAAARDDVDFIKRYIFPGCCIPSVGALTAALVASSDLRLVHLDDIGADYAITLRRWRENLLANVHAVRGLGHSEEFIRMWEFYFAYCEAGFAERALGDVHAVFEGLRR